MVNTQLRFFHDHISTKKIKEIYPEIVPNNFKFEPVTKDNIKDEIQKLNVKKIVNTWFYSSYDIKRLY